MNELLKKPYEISLWEDVLQSESCYLQEITLTEESYEPGVYYYESGGNNVNHYVLDYGSTLKDGRQYYKIASSGTLSFQRTYYKEQKLCIIGSNTMTSPIRAVNAKLVSNINGTSTLTFSLYSKYWDEELEEFLDNPFLQYMTNERKIKVRYGDTTDPDCKWYDLIVKNISENSDTKTFDYTAKDQFINELSKSGFDIVLDTELGNNIGTIGQLANIVLDGSDWRLDDNNVDVIRQYREEPLYKITLNRSLGTLKEMLTGTEISIPGGQEIYAFYSIIEDKNPNFQFIYYNSVDGYNAVNKNGVLIKPANYTLSSVVYGEDGLPDFASSMELSHEYRGQRLVRQELIEFDESIKKYVNVYKDSSGQKIYGFTDTEYISPATVENLITNSSAFTNTSGWNVGRLYKEGETIKNEAYPELKVVGIPDIKESSSDPRTFYLQYTPTQRQDCLFNSGLDNKRTLLNGFAEGEIYILKAEFNNENPNFDFQIGTYIFEDGIYTIQKTLFKKSSSTSLLDGSIELSCQSSISASELAGSRIGIFIRFESWNKTYLIKDFQFFQKKTQLNSENEEEIIYPGSLKTNSLVKEKYYYYVPSTYTSIEEIPFLYVGYEESENYTKCYNDENNERAFEKIRTISASKSNRFNLIQQLAETFECWPRFTVERNMQTGEILFGKDKPGFTGPESERFRYQKWVSFQEEILQENYVGFKYGINLKSIKRTLESDNIVSKIIVKDNTNQFAEDGFCSIARSKENYSGENFILDFSYYIQQKLMDASIVNNDLYLDVNGYLGYYKNLRRLNKNRDSIIKRLSFLTGELANYESSYKTYKNSVDSAEEEKAAKIIKLEQKTEIPYDELWEDRNEAGSRAIEWWSDPEIIADFEAIKRCEYIISIQGPLRDNAEQNLKSTQAEKISLEAELEELAFQKKGVNKEFYKKYSRYIQEGSWTSEDYTDDTLYYLDAESTLHTSSQPKVNYTIDVIELSQVEDFENYKFKLGDKTYIEDTEFFGWDYSNGYKTPYQEEIVVTETTIVFDSPEKNIIKVQNYKTSFEDLFQRITATTQALQFSSGDYQRAANIMTEDGKIEVDVLQNSMANNALRLENAKDQSIVWDESGLVTTSLSSPHEMLRLISGGLFVSNDGGETWTTGITANGINASLITTGQINTAAINITNGTASSFRWDSHGISAYYINIDGAENRYYSPNQFVRFDHYGIYGIANSQGFNPDEPSENGKVGEEKIWNSAKYALTWKGFMLKSDNKNGGYISITSDNDFQVFGPSEEGIEQKIKIGKLNAPEEGESGLYGIRIGTESNPVLETGSDGNLWLRNTLLVGLRSTNETNVKIGYDEGKTDGKGNYAIIQAGGGADESSFIVYENGKMVASNGEFIGSVVATSGEIKELMYIGEVEGSRIVLDGGTTSVRSENNSFSITPDLATFNNINCRGTIRTAIFEKDTVQAIGGMMIFKTAFEIKEYKNLNTDPIKWAKLKLDKPYKGEEYGNTPKGKVYWIKLGGKKFYIVRARDGQKIEIPASEDKYYEFGIEEEMAKNKTPVICVKFNRLDGNVVPNDLPPLSELWREYENSLESDSDEKVLPYDDYYLSWAKENPIPSVKYTIEETIIDDETGASVSETSIFYLPAAADSGGILDKEAYDYGNNITKPILKSEYGCIRIQESPNSEIALLVSGDSFSSDYNKVVWYNYSSDNPLVLIETTGVNDATTLIHIGQQGEMLIGINSTKGNWREYLYPEGLTMKSIDLKTVNNEKMPEVFIGNLNTLAPGNSLYHGYGLYSENVFLTGSLTTKSYENSDSTYAGVNTKNGAKANKFGDNTLLPNSNIEADNSSIVFWAGATGIGDEQIQEAPFQVTERGSIYAARAVFENSVFSNGTVYGADIYTARIHGYEDSNVSSLTFYDAATGISFKKTEGDEEKEVFSVGSDGLKCDDQYIIKIIEQSEENSEENSEGTITEKTVTFSTIGSSHLNITKNIIKGSEDGLALEINKQNFSFTDTNNNNYSLTQGDGGWNLYIWAQEVEE